MPGRYVAFTVRFWPKADLSQRRLLIAVAQS